MTGDWSPVVGDPVSETANVSRKLTVGSLFAGIGGFDLGLERAGMEVRWQVEIDPFARAVLEKHWPHVRRYEDVRRVHRRSQDACPFIVYCRDCLPVVDVLCGGFPCQDISSAGNRVGIDGARSGLWREFWRLIGELRPRYAIVENVSALLNGGMGRVLGDLAAIGFDAEWDCIPAAAIGAPHRRDRVWILAYPKSVQLRRKPPAGAVNVGYSGARTVSGRSEARTVLADTDDQSQPGRAFNASARRSLSEFVGRNEWWRTEPDVGRVAHGIPARMDRLSGLGNAIVPQIAEWIGCRILEAESQANP